MPHRHTAGTARARFTVATQPHTFRPEGVDDWGYRPRCLDCGGERNADLHRKQR